MAMSVSLLFPQKRSHTSTLTVTLFFFSLLLLLILVVLLLTTTTLHLSRPPADLFSPTITALLPPPPPPSAQPITSLNFEKESSGSQVIDNEDGEKGQPPPEKEHNGEISVGRENGQAPDSAISSVLEVGSQGAEEVRDEEERENDAEISSITASRPLLGNGSIDIGEEGGHGRGDGDGDVGLMKNEGKWEDAKGCDLYMGKWVRDQEYPIYRPSSCPYVDQAFDCQSNGRPDSEYLRWRWKPDGCHLPRFNAIDFLQRLRGKRLMLVGDSMNRNQFESMLCLLREGLPDKSKMFETHGYKITKGRGYYVFKFMDYNCTVEFVRSHFLVKEGIRINGQGNSNPTLSIDRIDKTAARWKKADILIFNTGHWWTHGKTARGKNYYKERDHIYPKFDAVEAYRRALMTWAKWIDNNVKPRKKLVFYRAYSSAHFRGGDWDSGGSCNGEREPLLSSGASFLDNYPLKMKIVEEVIQQMKFPVILLNVTRLTNFRKDGHPSIYGKNRTATAGVKVSTRRQDCSHWCLPGVPDAWNELIYATLVSHQSPRRRLL
ncbi:Protein trichome birefringence-like 5 [Dionaea muscipula]